MRRNTMNTFRKFGPATFAALTLAAALAATPAVQAKQPGGEPRASATDGVVRVKSRYPIDETIARLRKDIESKGITFFQLIDQSQLAAGAGIKLRPSALLVFGNPGLGSQFITSEPAAGLDWPVRLLVTQDDAGQVWAVYSDFTWIARRHGIGDRDAQFGTATGVVASITSSVTK
jgi:uncharacterized protein (DUF302 family)